MAGILDLINRATELIDEGLTIYNRLRPEISDVGSAIGDDTLAEAKARLEASLQRAQAAHDDLAAAIDARLNK
jgi:hypothetical protein